VTPFDSWYAANIAPALKDAPAAAQKAAKASAAEIWNAAVGHAQGEVMNFFLGGDNLISGQACVAQLGSLKAQVTP
jgi:hypothetical protein